MDFELNEEQVMIKTAAREFLETECPKKLVRTMMEDPNGYSPDLWAKMAGLGWQGLVVPEKYGGSGVGFVELAVLLEEMGRALVPGPFLPTVVLVGRPIDAFGTEEQKKNFMPKIASGKAIMTLAFQEQTGTLEASEVTMKAIKQGDNFILHGIKLFVQDAQIADYILTAARTKDTANKEDGITLFILDAKTPGIKVNLLQTLTGEKQCEVIFDNVKTSAESVLGKVDEGWLIMQRILIEGAVANCAWMTGGARWIIDTTVEYAKTRIAFGVPIGLFQANQHKLANMSIEVEGSTSITYYAAWTISQNDPAMAMAASIAKTWCSDSYKHAANEGIQIHGGIGFTWDHDAGLYLKRAKTCEIAFGDADYHREKIAQMINL